MDLVAKEKTIMANTHSKQLILNSVLLLIIGVLGFLVWWQVTKPSVVTTTLLPIAKAEINVITLKRNLDSNAPEIIRLQKQGEQWYTLEPKSYPINHTRMTQLFTLLDESVDASYPAAGKDLQRYGLIPGKVELSFNEHKFLFGEDNPVSHKRYILSAGTIYLVSEAVSGLLQGDVLDLLATKLVPSGRTLKQVTLPDNYVRVPQLTQNWQSADAIQIDAWDGKGESKGQVVLNLDDGSQVILQILSDQGELVLGNTSLGLRYHLVEGQIANLMPKK